MSKLLHRMWRSPRLSRVLFAVAAPTLATIFFAPAWAIGLSILAALGAATFIYSEVLSPKYVQQEKKARSSRAEAVQRTPHQYRLVKGRSGGGRGVSFLR